MKRFRYPLESLMRLKKARLENELAKIEQIAAGISLIEERRLALGKESQSASLAVAAAASVDGWQLSALNRFHRYALEENHRLVEARLKSRERLEAQRRMVVEAHKQVRILEVLKEKRLANWRAEADKEQEQLVSELVIAQWNARRSN